MGSPCRNGLDPFQLLQMFDEIIFRHSGRDVEFFNHHILDLMEAPFSIDEFPDAPSRFVEGVNAVQVSDIVSYGNKDTLFPDLPENKGITLEVHFR